ncbi:unnamed protein product [Rotaria sp. Silwood1]|nr:unnamed protein product [Rotaria sp. Silwood1]CAF3865055.1 unnamed protein product [Rotaria sp. Silwood1]
MDALSATFRELVEAADEDMVAAGNFTQCPTIEALKKFGVDYRKKMRFDEDVFRECRILSCFYRKEDTTSEKILGNESENMTTASSSNKSKSSSKAPSEKISINESSRSSIRDSLSSSEAATKVRHEYSNDISNNLDVPMNNDHQQSEISMEISLNTSSSSILTNTLIAVNEADKVTTNQLSKYLSINIQTHPEATINGFTLKWPKFEVKNVLFKGNKEKN